MSNLYQDAILDAKALRASAIANAKAALEEAFEPKIQEMISKHLSEESTEEKVEENYDTKEEGYNEEGMMPHGDEPMEEISEDITEEQLEEILNQLEEMSEPKVDESLNEAEEEGEEEEKEEEGEEVEAEETVDVNDETKVIEITVGDLKEILKSVMPGQEMPAAEPAGPEAEKEAEVSLEEILQELSLEEDAASVQRTAPGAHGDLPGTMEEEGLQEKKHKKGHDEEDEEEEDHKKELEEAKATIEKLREDLQEVNLLNAKYLYMNKLFKSKSLTESQKMKVVNALDRATTVAEVKNAYETLKEAFETKKETIKESIGFASKPAGVAPKANIVEADGFISRWQKLAGINK